MHRDENAQGVAEYSDAATMKTGRKTEDEEEDEGRLGKVGKRRGDRLLRSHHAADTSVHQQPASLPASHSQQHSVRLEKLFTLTPFAVVYTYPRLRVFIPAKINFRRSPHETNSISHQGNQLLIKAAG